MAVKIFMALSESYFNFALIIPLLSGQVFFISLMYFISSGVLIRDVTSVSAFNLVGSALLCGVVLCELSLKSVTVSVVAFSVSESS